MGSLEQGIKAKIFKKGAIQAKTGPQKPGVKESFDVEQHFDSKK